jgi:phosphoglycolate phosphatase
MIAPPRFSHVIFDLDGTLVNAFEDLATAANLVRQDFGLAPLPVARIRSFVGRGVEFLLAQTLATDDQAQIRLALEHFGRHYRRHLLDSTECYPGVRETLPQLEKCRIFVATNKPLAFARDILAGLALLPYFQQILGGDSVERKKPDPEMIHRIIQAFPAEKSSYLMIGDSSIDIATGHNAGIATVGVTYGLGSAAEFRQSRADFIVESFSELPRILFGQAQDHFQAP